MSGRPVNDGGPAFPSEFVLHKAMEVGNQVPIMAQSSGMSLRDYFAAKAMPVLIDLFSTQKLSPKDDGPVHESHIAEQAYAFADAMLAARSKP